MKAETVVRMKQTGAMAVVRIDTIQRGYEIADGLIAGGIDVLEVSFTNPNADQIIRKLKEKYHQSLLVGAGTVLDLATARAAYAAGCDFMVAPNFDPEIATFCNLYQIPYGPGCSSYSEALTALKAGASFIKAFPISNYYGPDLAKVFKVPCPFMPILASGGVNLENAAQWIQNGTDVLGAGSLLTKGDSETIKQNATQLKRIIDETRGQLK